MSIKPQDIVVALKILLSDAGTTYADLGLALGLSPSQVLASVRRLEANGLVEQVNRRTRRVVRTKLRTFFEDVVPRTFPAVPGAITRGMPTAHAVPPLSSQIAVQPDDLPPVWPEANGTVRGYALTPIHKCAVQAAKKDPLLYEYLALLDALRSGRTREKEIAMQELGARLIETPNSTPVGSTSRFGLTEEVIDRWSETVAAQSALPDLVRRLVLALVPLSKLRAICFPAHSAANQSGFDGRIETMEPFPLLADTAMSVWELGTGADFTKHKALDDLRKRSENPLGVNVHNTTYVALTSRIWREKQAWLQKARKDSPWASIRAYDATDIVQWLQLAPGVRAGFGETLDDRYREDGIDTVESYMAKWTGRTNPPFNNMIALAGRKQEEERFEQWVGGKPNSMLIQADTVEECAVFCCSVILASEEPRRSYHLARTLVVTSVAAWQRVLKTLSSANRSALVLVPAFGDFDGSLFGTDGHHLLIPRDRNAALRGEKPAIDLHAIDREPLAKALVEIVKEPDLAQRLAYDCGGVLSVLQRRPPFGYSPPPPPWVKEENGNLLSAMLFAGAWNPQNPADQGVLLRLAGLEAFEQIEELTAQLLRVPDPPIRMQGVLVKWRSASDTWEWLFGRLTPRQVDRFEKVAIEALAKTSPRFDLPSDERMYAAMRNAELPESEELRAGLAEGVARLSTLSSRPNGSTLLRPTDVEVVVSRIVSSVLKDHSWQRWASLGENLQPLAEASPNAFLDALESAARNDADNFAPLFSQDVRGNIFSDCSQAGLVWAIDALAWEPKRFDRVVRLLVDLTHLDRGGQYNNRPDETLFDLFHPLVKHTDTPNQSRLKALKSMTEDPKSIPAAWRILVHNLNVFSRPGAVDEPTKPRFLPTKQQATFADYSREEIYATLDETKKLTRGLLKQQPTRLLDLFEKGLIDPICSDLLDWAEQEFEVLRVLPAQETLAIQQHLRSWAADRRRLFKDRVPIACVERAEQLAEKLAADDPIRGVAWLFSQNAGVSIPTAVNDWEALERERERRRTEALNWLMSREGGFDNILALVVLASEPWLVGQTLARLPNAGDCAHPVINRSLGHKDNLGLFARSFIVRRMADLDAGWVTTLADWLLAKGQQDKVVNLLTAVRSTREIRNWLTKQGAEFASSYWQQVEIDGAVFDDSEEFGVAIQNLLAFSRWDQALKATVGVVLHGKCKCRTENLLTILRFPFVSAGFVLKKEFAGIMRWAVPETFKMLDNRTDAPLVEIARLEVLYFEILEHTDRPPKHVFAVLAEKPMEFESLVNDLFRPASVGKTDMPTDSDVQENRQNRAHCAFKLLHGWHGYPGEKLPPDQRDITLRSWCDQVLELTRRSDREIVGQHQVGEVLARVPAPESDGVWPCKVAREYLREGKKEIRLGLHAGHFNSKGVSARIPGGQQERDQARRFERDADRIRDEWPETAEFLDEMARYFLWLAYSMDQADAKFTDP